MPESAGFQKMDTLKENPKSAAGSTLPSNYPEFPDSCRVDFPPPKQSILPQSPHCERIVSSSPATPQNQGKYNLPIKMAIKKSELYTSLWQSCDELRGGMDASQYKDYVLVLLFIKYVSDKYAGHPFAPVTIPEGAGFHDMVALKGNPEIGDQINKKIIAPLAAANKLITDSGE